MSRSSKTRYPFTSLNPRTDAGFSHMYIPNSPARVREDRLLKIEQLPRVFVGEALHMSRVRLPIDAGEAFIERT